MKITASMAKGVADSFSSNKLDFYKKKCIAIIEDRIKEESNIGGYRITFDTMEYLEGEDYGAVHSRRLSLMLKEALVLELVSNGFKCESGLNFSNTDFCISWE